MAYPVSDNFKCCVCGITEKEAEKTQHGVDVTRGQYEVTSFETSFNLSYGTSTEEGKAWCAPCHKEQQLKSLFDLMDKKK